MNNAADEKKKEILESIEKFRNRKIYTHLDPEILAGIPDEDLDQVVFDYINVKIKHSNNELADLSRMSTSFQMVFSTWLLECEVIDGGFNQFFFNSSGKFADMALRCLKEINAMEHFNVLQQAIEIHKKENRNPILQKLFARRSLEAFSESYKFTSLGECDKAYFAIKYRLRDIRNRYIREHPDLFIGD